MCKSKIKRQKMGNWLYHATTAALVDKIRGEGLTVNKDRAVICLSVSHTSAWPLGRGVRHLFRVKAKDVNIDKRIGMTEVRTKTSIAVDKMQYCTGQPNVSSDWEPAKL